mgnify:CR=1 FL=1
MKNGGAVVKNEPGAHGEERRSRREEIALFHSIFQEIIDKSLLLCIMRASRSEFFDIFLLRCLQLLQGRFYLQELGNLIRKLPVAAGSVVLAPVVRVVRVGICHAELYLLGVLNLDVDTVTLDG